MTWSDVAAEQIAHKLALLVYKCRQGVAPSYLPDDRHRRSTSSTSRIVNVADCLPYTVNRRWPSFYSRRPLCLERSSAARHVSTVTGHLTQSPQTHLFKRCFPWLYRSRRAREVTCHYGNVNRFCYLLLTYLAKYSTTRSIAWPLRQLYDSTAIRRSRFA